MSEVRLSRIERAVQPYTQEVLELAAEVYGTKPEIILAQPPKPKGVFKVHDGCGFRVGKYVITVKECLPREIPRTYDEDRIYPRILGQLGGEQTVWAALAFADLLSGLVILEALPDNQEEANAYEQLLSSTASFAIADISPNKEVHAKVLSSDDEWISCAAWHGGGPIFLRRLREDLEDLIVAGSPVLHAGKAIGVVTSRGLLLDGKAAKMCCRLVRNLPQWFPTTASEAPLTVPDTQ